MIQNITCCVNIPTPLHTNRRHTNEMENIAGEREREREGEREREREKEREREREREGKKKRV